MVSEVGRPRRGAARRSRLGSGGSGLPSAVHYVGYVEDDETPEMIMKKFEALERVKRAAQDKRRETAAVEEEEAVARDPLAGEVDGNDRDGGAQAESGEGPAPTGSGKIEKSDKDASGYDDNNLDESDLLEVFKQTSFYSVKSAQTNNELLMDAGGDAEAFWEEDLNESDFELDEDEFWGEGVWRKKRGRRGTGSSRSGGSGGGLRKTVTVLNRETGVYVQRKVRVVDETLPQLLRVPKDPLPLSWGRTVKPYAKRGEAAVAVEDSQLVREEYITHMDFGKLKRKETYLGVLINPDWAVEDNEAGGDRLQCLRNVPLTKLCPTGFIFIWIEKRDVQNVCDWMYKQNYAYVENLTWVQMLSNNKMVHDESKYMRKSHLTLYIFRKQNEGKDIELRHQRNPDVVLDCVRASSDGHGKIPEEAYKAIETLLPGGRGRLLELWSAPDGPREGWTHVVETI